MNRRRILAAGAVVVGVAVLYGLGGYQPATAGTDAPFEDADPNGSSASHMSLSTNGDRFVTYDVRTDDPDGEILLSAAFENASHVRYWRDNRSVTRSTATTVGQYERVLRLSQNERLVEHDNESMTAIVVETDAEPPGGGRGLLLSVLDHPGYERTGTTTYEGRTVAVYAAQGGWYDTDTFTAERTAYRIESASGVLYVDADTEQLLFANVTFQFVRADTWGDYLATKFLRGVAPSTAIDVAVDPGSTNVTRPAWAPAPAA